MSVISPLYALQLEPKDPLAIVLLLVLQLDYPMEKDPIEKGKEVVVYSKDLQVGLHLHFNLQPQPLLIESVSLEFKEESSLELVLILRQEGKRMEILKLLFPLVWKEVLGFVLLPMLMRLLLNCVGNLRIESILLLLVELKLLLLLQDLRDLEEIELLVKVQ